MKSIKDILRMGSVLTMVFLVGTPALAERGPQQESIPAKKTFDELLNDPSAILDMDEDELAGLLPPMDNKVPPLVDASKVMPPLGKTEAPRNISQNPNSTSTLMIAGPFSSLMPPPIPTAPPPGTVDPKAVAATTAAAGATSTAGAPLSVLQALPLVLAPSFFVMTKPGTPPGIHDVPSSTAMTPIPGVPDISIILANNQFYPSRIKLKDGMQTRLIFTTTNKRSAALVIERLQIQRWIAKEDEHKPSSENERIRWDVSRELNASRVTEIVMDPKTGVYSFHDAMSGASGEITVE